MSKVKINKRRGFFHSTGIESFSVEAYGRDELSITLSGYSGTLYMSGKAFAKLAKAVAAVEEARDDS